MDTDVSLSVRQVLHERLKWIHTKRNAKWNEHEKL